MENKKKINLTFYSDPGHGWLKVPNKLIQELGISDKISSYSYIKSGFSYLEEDCDAHVFLNKIEGNGSMFDVCILDKHVNESSIIRTYPQYDGGL